MSVREVWEVIKEILEAPVRWVLSWLVPLLRISDLTRKARRTTNTAERNAVDRNPAAWRWWREKKKDGLDSQGWRIPYYNIDRARWGVFSGTDTTPDLNIDTYAEAPDPPTRVPLDPPPLALRAWLNLAIATATWYSAQADPLELDWWEQIPQAVLDRTDNIGISKEHGWAYNELAAIARLRGNLDKAQDLLRVAEERRGHRGRGQILTNQMLLRVTLAMENPDLGTRVGLLATDGTDDRAHRLHARKDHVGKALTKLTQGATTILRAETAVAAHLNRRDVQRSQRQGPDDGVVVQIQPDERDEATRTLLDAEEQLKAARRGFQETGQLRAEMAARADLVLVYHSLSGVDIGQARDYLDLAGTELKQAQAIHGKLDEFLHRDDRAAKAAFLLNRGAGLVWHKPPDGRPPDSDKINEGMELLRESVKLWSQHRQALPQAKRLLACEGRCRLYLGDGDWRFATLAEGVDSEVQRRKFLSACENWFKAFSCCQSAGDVVGARAAERRPGERKSKEQRKSQGENEDEEAV